MKHRLARIITNLILLSLMGEQLTYAQDKNTESVRLNEFQSSNLAAFVYEAAIGGTVSFLPHDQYRSFGFLLYPSGTALSASLIFDMLVPFIRYPLFLGFGIEGGNNKYSMYGLDTDGDPYSSMSTQYLAPDIHLSIKNGVLLTVGYSYPILVHSHMPEGSSSLSGLPQDVLKKTNPFWYWGAGWSFPRFALLIGFRYYQQPEPFDVEKLSRYYGTMEAKTPIDGKFYFSIRINLGGNINTGK